MALYLIIFCCLFGWAFGESPWAARKRKRDQLENEKRREAEWNEMKRQDPNLRGDYNSDAGIWR